MSGGAFGGARGYQPRPPEKGVFPLDHFGECKQAKEEYMACLQQHDGNADACQEVAKRYLQCRMERNLMASQDLKELGFLDGREGRAAAREVKEGGGAPQAAPQQQRKEAQGFVAGMSQFDKR